MPQGTIAASGGKLLVDLIQQLNGELKSARHCQQPPWFPRMLSALLPCAISQHTRVRVRSLKPMTSLTGSRVAS